MSTPLDHITPELETWLASQHMFFVATAPVSPDAHINCSPKGLDAFRVLGPHADDEAVRVQGVLHREALAQELRVPGDLSLPIEHPTDEVNAIAAGIETSRLHLLLAVLSRRGGINTGAMDVVASVSGGMRLRDPGADLAVLAALASAASLFGSAGKSANCARFGPLGTAVKARRLTPRSASCASTRYAAPSSSRMFA